MVVELRKESDPTIEDVPEYVLRDDREDLRVFPGQPMPPLHNGQAIVSSLPDTFLPFNYHNGLPLSRCLSTDSEVSCDVGYSIKKNILRT